MFKKLAISVKANCCPFALLLLLSECLAIQSPGENQSKDFSSELLAARREVIETHEIKIRNLELGTVTLGKNTFNATAKNKTKSPLMIGLDLATQPGLWLRKRFQKQFVFELKPEEEKQIEAPYEFLRMTPEAYLSVGFGIPVMKEAGAFEIKGLFFEKQYYVGKGNQAVDYAPSNFNKYGTEHFEIYCYKGSLAEKEVVTIKQMRESAFREISNLLQVGYDRKIRLVFYPNGETKKRDVGHTGDGYAFANNIVEIYNEQTKLDPFHELAHIIAGKLGHPPAMFNEGFAVYVSEKLGADALKYLGSPGKTINHATEEHLREGKLIRLDELLGFPEIGSEKSNWQISYPEAASLVKYLIESYGLPKFRQVYQRTTNGDESDGGRKNAEVLRTIYGKSLSEIEREWRNKLSTNKALHRSPDKSEDRVSICSCTG